jgi:multidrug resistance efflux pump
MAQLERAVEAYRAAQARVPQAEADAKALVRSARDEVATARAELAAAMVDAALNGVRQVDIIRLTGYSREQVRSILRAHGVEA